MASYNDFDESCEEEFLEDCIALPSNFQPGVIQLDITTPKEGIQVKKEIITNVNKEEMEEEISKPLVISDSKLNECERKKYFDEIEQNWHSYGS
jgi:hypothetical protein